MRCMCTQKTGISHRMRILEIPTGREIPETWEIPGSEQFKAIWAGVNGNFPLNIADILTGSFLDLLFLHPWCIFYVDASNTEFRGL